MQGITSNRPFFDVRCDVTYHRLCWIKGEATPSKPARMRSGTRALCCMALGLIWLVWRIGAIILLPLLVSDCKGGAGVGQGICVLFSYRLRATK